MLRNLYAIEDVVACETGPIFDAKNDDVARRNFCYQLINAHVTKPSDFVLRRLGTYDNETQSLIAEPPVTIPTSEEEVQALFLKMQEAVKEAKNG